MKRLCVLLSLAVSAQVRVLSPASLLKLFVDGGPLAAPNGIIPASTSTFGTPTYGESLVGRLLLINSTSCELDYAEELEERYNVTKVREENHSLKDILLVKRGGCSFVRKVAVAEQAGAQAVIIIDSPDSPWDRRQISQVILADDGNGQRVSIPSVLVDKDDGMALASADFHQAPPLVTMEWNLPQKAVVAVDFWTSSGSLEASRFLAAVAPAVARLKGLLDFRTHYFVLRMHTSVEAESTQHMCLDNEPSLCVSPPDAGASATPQDVLKENLRQLCLAEVYPTALKALNEANQSLQFSEKWWQYVQELPTACPLRLVDQTQPDKVFGPVCSQRLLKSVGADPAAVEDCIGQKGRALMEREQNNNAWAVNAIRVNGARFSGNLEPLLVVQAVCSAFEQTPKECSQTIEYLTQQQQQSMGGKGGVIQVLPITRQGSWMHVLVILLILSAGLFAGVYFYQAYSNNGLRRALRHEVMLEVKSQLQDYYRVEEPVYPDTGGARQAREMEFSKLKFRV